MATVPYYHEEGYRTEQDLLDLEYKPFGIKLPTWLMWSMVHVKHLPKHLQEKGLQLYINKVAVSGYWSLLYALIRPRNVSYETFEQELVSTLKQMHVVGINIPLSPHSLLDHIVFVYGYDENNFYVFDTHQIPQFPYEKLTDDHRFVMKLPKQAVKQRLGRWSRVWKVVPRETTKKPKTPTPRTSDVLGSMLG